MGLISLAGDVTASTPAHAFVDTDVSTAAPDAAVARLAALSCEFSPELRFAIFDDLNDVESEWRRFEQVADCTAFQTFDWLATWHRHIGRRDGVKPVIVIAMFTGGDTAFILPLAIGKKRGVRCLSWFGQELCDYNAPLLAPDFSQRISSERFLAVWQDLRQEMQHDPRWRHDWIAFEKMPQTVGGQTNPFAALDVTLNASGAHLTHLGDDWDKFYFAKRSSATRRHDRAKRRHMAKFGDVRFVTCTESDDARRTLQTLFDQKHRTFARRGIPDIFERQGLREFFFDLVSNPKIRQQFHISRLEVGDTWAAANFAILFGDCYYHVLASYEDDAALSQYGPGTMHLRELLAHAITFGLRRFDFTIGDEPYKDEWSDISVKLYDYSAAATWRGAPASAASTARWRLKRFVKQTPSLWRLVSRVRSTLGALRHPKETRRSAVAKKPGNDGAA
jgi:CelD/BcsL family acetyltransferase involved in cellulose biosynthesis